jgi:hypothetical protein
MRKMRWSGDHGRPDSLEGYAISSRTPVSAAGRPPNPILSTLRYFRDAPHVKKTCLIFKMQRGGGGMTTPIRVKTLTINGRDVSALENDTVLQVARENDIFIPTLCEVNGLSTIGACRLCLVEIKGRPRLFPACVLPVEEGTNHYRIGTPCKYRRMVVELLFSNAITSARSASQTDIVICKPRRAIGYYARALSIS